MTNTNRRGFLGLFAALPVASALPIPKVLPEPVKDTLVSGRFTGYRDGGTAITITNSGKGCATGDTVTIYPSNLKLNITAGAK